MHSRSMVPCRISSRKPLARGKRFRTEWAFLAPRNTARHKARMLNRDKPTPGLCPARLPHLRSCSPGFRRIRHPKRPPAPSCSSGCPLRRGTARGELLGAAQRHAAPAASFHQGRAGEAHGHPAAAEPPGIATTSLLEHGWEGKRPQGQGKQSCQQRDTEPPGGKLLGQT